MKKEISKNNSCKRYKAIIFDLDGTLINSMPYHELAFKDLLLEHGVRIDEKNLKKLLGLSTRLILKGLKKKYKFKENIENLREERRYHYFKFLGTKNIIFPGVMKKLEKLRLDYKIAIATGSSFVTYNHSADEDFKKMFDAVVTINDVKKERGKPFPDQLLLAAKQLKVKPRECLMIGDSIYDGLAAKRAKMDFIGVLTGYTTKKELAKEKPIRVLSSVKDLKL
jgi:HAD superfamily hydrolase (TIGR01509 family)